MTSEKTRGDQTEDEFNNLENIEMLDILDRTISRDEIKKVITKLKNGKAAGIDRISPELLKEFNDNILSIVALILNKILESSNFPKDWALGVIVILFKDGDKSEHRSITLLSMLAWEIIGRCPK